MKDANKPDDPKLNPLDLLQNAIERAKQDYATVSARRAESKNALKGELAESKKIWEELSKQPLELQNLVRKELELPLISRAPKPITPPPYLHTEPIQKRYARPQSEVSGEIKADSLLEIRQIADLLARRGDNSDEEFQRYAALLDDAYTMCLIHPRDRFGIPVSPTEISSQSDRWVTGIGAETFLRSRSILKSHLIGSSGATSTPQQAAKESPQERQQRRLNRYFELGGKLARVNGDTWHTRGREGALADLVREEKAARRPMSDRKNVKDDLNAAMSRRDLGE